MSEAEKEAEQDAKRIIDDCYLMMSDFRIIDEVLESVSITQALFHVNKIIDNIKLLKRDPNFTDSLSHWMMVKEIIKNK